MTPGDRCKVCRSQYLPDIERWHYVDRLGFREISRRLKRELNVDIGRESIRNHFQDHPRVPDEVKKQYEERQARTRATAGEIVDEIAILDQLILDELETHRLLQAWSRKLFESDQLTQPEDLPRIPMAFVSMAGTTVAEIRQLIKTKSDLMNGDLKGAEAQMIIAAAKKAHEHRMHRLNGP